MTGAALSASYPTQSKTEYMILMRGPFVGPLQAVCHWGTVLSLKSSELGVYASKLTVVLIGTFM